MHMDTDDREVGHDLLLEYVMGDLDEQQAARFEQHLARCSRCRTDALSLLPVHAELLTMYPDVPSAENIGQAKSAALQHAFSCRLPNVPVGPADGCSPSFPLGAPSAGRLAGFLASRRYQASRRVQRVALACAAVGALTVGALFTWNEHMERSAAVVPAPSRTGRQGSGAVQTAAGPPTATGGPSGWAAGGGQGSGLSTAGGDTLAAMLHPTAAFFGARGQVRVLTQQSVRRMVVQVSEVPIQSHLGCYEVWQEYGGRLHSLGEFLVNSRGEGQITMVLPRRGPQGRIVVTLEPRWGDVNPLGPTVLRGQVVRS